MRPTKIACFVAILFAFLLIAAPRVWAAESLTVGGACTTGQGAFDWDAGWQCNSSVWARAPLYMGSAGATACNSTYAGMIQWTGTAFTACNGSAWSPLGATTGYSAGSSTTIDWSNGTTQYTTANCAAMTFSNMADGGTYQLFVEGTTSGTCSFTHSGLTFKMPSNHGATTASTMTAYTFTRAGTYVFVAWIPGY